MKVLIVDTSAANRQLYRTWLQEKWDGGLEFSEAASGSEGLDACLSAAPECLILEYKLIDMNGLEFLEQMALQSSAEACGRPGIVMVTGAGNEQVAVDAMKAGAHDYLVKDRVTADNLSAALQRAVETVGERERMTVSLKQQEALLHETHHRLKNNLQVIASLLRLQAAAAVDRVVIDALWDSVHRVESVALIHEQLYGSGNYREVNMAQHVAALMTRMVESFGINVERVRWRVSMEPLSLVVDRAIPAGLILNELISNSFKHAFPDGRRGSIVVSGARHEDGIVLEVRDDGVGFPEGGPELSNAENNAESKTGSKDTSKKSFGLKIVRILTRQLRGTFAVENRSGAACRLSFRTG